MELLDTSLDRFYKNVYAHGERLPVRIIGFITAAVLVFFILMKFSKTIIQVVRALYYLKHSLKIIHRGSDF